MKNRIQYIVLLLCVSFGLTNCSDNENWKIVEAVPEGVYLSGSATVFSAVGPAAAFKVASLDQDADKTDYPEIVSTPDMQIAYTWLKAGGELFVTKADKEGNTVNYGKGALVSGVTYKAEEGGAAFTVEKDGLYQVIYNQKDGHLTILPADFGVIGDATPEGWNGETLFESVTFDEKMLTVTYKGTFSFGKGSMKVRFGKDWGILVPYGDKGNILVHTNEGSSGSADNEIKLTSSPVDLKPGGKNLEVSVGAAYEVTMIFSLRTGKFTISAAQGEIIVPTYPEELYMIGEEFGNWDWSAESIVKMAPVHSVEGAFWTIKYFTAGKGFKWASAKSWDDAKFNFAGLSENKGFTVGDNASVEKDGLYMVYIDMKADKIVIEEPKVYGKGDAFGGWDEGVDPVAFTLKDKLITATTKNTEEKNLRMYATSSLAKDVDWWKMEFNIFDGKIVYRGTGGDQEAVPVKAGAKVTLDFSTDTGTIE